MLMKIKAVNGFHAPFLELGQFDLKAALRRHLATQTRRYSFQMEEGLLYLQERII
jgi:hypothetical protein